jgi:ATP-binding cassette, subfamily G (WHITE), member 2
MCTPSDIKLFSIFLAVALIIVVLIFVVMMVFSGFLVDLASVFNWLSWIQWISAFRYGSNILTINEFQKITFCLPDNANACPLTGSDVLAKRALDHASDWDMWKHFLALTMMSIVFLLLSFFQLHRMNKKK